MIIGRKRTSDAEDLGMAHPTPHVKGRKEEITKASKGKTTGRTIVGTMIQKTLIH